MHVVDVEQISILDVVVDLRFRIDALGLESHLEIVKSDQPRFGTPRESCA